MELRLAIPRCHLLDLPTEIRVAIYQYLFLAAQLSVGAAHLANVPCGFSICSCDFPWHITRTCRQLRDEATPYLLASSTLQLSSRLEKTRLFPTIYLETIPRAVVLDAKSFSNQLVLLAQMHGLRALELRNITVWCQYLDEAYFETEDGAECMYTLAMFNLKRISNVLTSLCNGDRRLFKVLVCCQFVVQSGTQETIVSFL